MVLLHAGVADRRCWRDVVPALAGRADVVVYDRRGFGETPPGGQGTHLEDLLRLLEDFDLGPAWLVGNSMGGALALDAALAAPERVAGLMLVGTAVSGAPQPGLADLDPATQDAVRALLAAGDDVEAAARAHTRLWLDGPVAPAGRVTGPPRDLALDMARTTLAHRLPENWGGGGGEAWSRLEELALPVTVVVGELDVPIGVTRSREVARRIPAARFVLLPGTAHLPSLDAPEALQEVLLAAVPAG